MVSSELICSYCSLALSPHYHDVTYAFAKTAAEHNFNFELTKDLPSRVRYRGTCCEDLGENWLRYNDTSMHYVLKIMT